MEKKYKIMIIIAVAVIVVSVVIFFYMKNKESESEKKQDTKKTVPISEGRKKVIAQKPVAIKPKVSKIMD